MTATRPNKRAKVEEESAFAASFFNREELKKAIADSTPYKHGVIDPLFNDQLLRDARREILENVSLTRKDTDIYTLNQSGDLANLKGLNKAESSKLKALNKVANAIYSKEFRDYLSYVTQSGPISGTKQDLSINIYDRGCHLLNHDDVIDTRRISFILYLTDPDDPWQANWGGALRLFPTVVANIPAPDWTVSIPPKWNQLAFFTVQPGRSFHDVEEVYINKARISISGWFHIPQKGEEGYIEGEKEATEARSSLSQLESSKLEEHDYPKRNFVEYSQQQGQEHEAESIGQFSQNDVDYLKNYLNETLFNEEAMDALKTEMENESMFEIKDFLNSAFAEKVKKAIDIDDLSDIPKRSTDIPPPWDIARPPHKRSYMYLPVTQTSAPSSSTNGNVDPSSSDAVIDNLASKDILMEINGMLASGAFKRWLQKVCGGYTANGRRIFARRFRPGHDFTLATPFDPKENHTLEATLCLTPSLGWEDGEAGGYDVCILKEVNESAEDAAVLDTSNNDDKVIFNNVPEWNVFHIILRDAEVDRFVKYVSKSAPGSRWDICGEWSLEDEEDDEDDEKKENEEDKE